MSNIEYTEFERLGITDTPREMGSPSGASAFPANTNLLYVDLAALGSALDSGPQACFPGMLVNLSKPAASFGSAAPQRGGRLECSMQNLADCLPDCFADRLPREQWPSALGTFVVYNQAQQRPRPPRPRRLSVSAAPACEPSPPPSRGRAGPVPPTPPPAPSRSGAR